MEDDSTISLMGKVKMHMRESIIQNETKVSNFSGMYPYFM